MSKVLSTKKTPLKKFNGIVEPEVSKNFDCAIVFVKIHLKQKKIMR